MAKGKKANGNGNSHPGFEATLWATADKLRGHLDAAEYKHVVLGLIFLKYISDAFEEKHAALKKDKDANPEDRDEYIAENISWVARKLGRMIDRVQRDLTPEDIAKVVGTYHAWRGDKGADQCKDIPGFCKSATLDDIRAHGHVLAEPLLQKSYNNSCESRTLTVLRDALLPKLLSGT